MTTILRMLDLSTSHLPQDVCANLGGYPGVVADDRQYGWFVWVPEDIEEHVAEFTPENYAEQRAELEANMAPPDDPNYADVHHEQAQELQLLDQQLIPAALIAIWRHARTHDCQYVLLDRDADIDSELPTYDW